jgi:adenylate kinase
VAKKRVVFLGPPNSGKGTQAVGLAALLGVPAISTGDMLRAEKAAGSELGKRVQSVLDSGQLVDDDLMAEVVTSRLAQSDALEGFLLDGYPRTLPQAATLEGILEGQGAKLDHVLLVEAPEEVLVKRALGRGRVDDTDEVVRERLRVYRRQTEPLVDYYRRQNLLQEIDGNQPIETVEGAIRAAVGSVEVQRS